MNTNQKLVQISPFKTNLNKKNKSHLKSFSNDSSSGIISNPKNFHNANSLVPSKQSSIIKKDKYNYSYKFSFNTSTKNETLKQPSFKQDQTIAKTLYKSKEKNKHSILEELDSTYDVNKKDSNEQNLHIPIKSTLRSLNLEHRKMMKKFFHEETSRTERKYNKIERIEQLERIERSDFSISKENSRISPCLSPVSKLKFNELEPISPLLKTPVKFNAKNHYLPKLQLLDSNSISYGNVFNSTYTQLSNKKVDSVYKTELRLRESINKGIASKNTTILSDKKTIQKISNFNTLSKHEDGKNPKLLVKEMYYEISDRKKFAQISKLLLNPPQFSESNACVSTKDTETPRNKKFHLPMPNLSKPNFFEINSNISFPSIVLDKNIICSVYNDNILNLKKYFNSKKSSRIGQHGQETQNNFYGSVNKISTRK
jgi:hypothetical protein